MSVCWCPLGNVAPLRMRAAACTAVCAVTSSRPAAARGHSCSTSRSGRVSALPMSSACKNRMRTIAPLLQRQRRAEVQTKRDERTRIRTRGHTAGAAVRSAGVASACRLHFIRLSRRSDCMRRSGRAEDCRGDWLAGWLAGWQREAEQSSVAVCHSPLIFVMLTNCSCANANCLMGWPASSTGGLAAWTPDRCSATSSSSDSDSDSSSSGRRRRAVGSVRLVAAVVPVFGWWLSAMVIGSGGKGRGEERAMCSVQSAVVHSDADSGSDQCSDSKRAAGSAETKTKQKTVTEGNANRTGEKRGAQSQTQHTHATLEQAPGAHQQHTATRSRSRQTIVVERWTWSKGGKNKNLGCVRSRRMAGFRRTVEQARMWSLQPKVLKFPRLVVLVADCL